MNMPPKEATTAAQVNTLLAMLQTLTHTLRPFQTGEDSIAEVIQDEGTRASVEVALIDVSERISAIAKDPQRWQPDVDREDAQLTKALQIEHLRYMQAQRRVAEVMEQQIRLGKFPVDSQITLGDSPKDIKPDGGTI